MASVKFLGFNTASHVALSVTQNGLSASGSTGAGGWGVPDTPTGDGGPISIVTTRSVEQVAPDSAGFTVDLSLATFDVQPPSGTVYDDQFHDLVYYWDFGDPGAWSAPVNVLSDWTDRNVGYGPFVNHMYRSPGTYTIGVTVIEPASGKMATATASVMVADPDIVYGGTNTIVLSDDPSESAWTGAPTGAQTFTDFETALTAYENLVGEGRFLFKRGGDFQKATNYIYAGANHAHHSLYFGTWGTGARPIMRRPAAGTFRTQVIEVATYFGALARRDVRLSGLNFIGEFDSTTTLGTATQGYRTLADIETLVDDCHFTGWDQALYLGIAPAKQRDEHRTHVNDTFISDFQNYPVYFGAKETMEIALTGTTIAQHVDAIWQQLGGGAPCRINGAAKTYIAGCDFYSGSGRSSTLQPCLKWHDGSYYDGSKLNLHTSSFEGGLFIIRIGGNPGGRPTRRVNALVHRCIIAGNYNTQYALPFGCNGMTFRNNLVIIPAGLYHQSKVRTLHPSFGSVLGDSEYEANDTPNKAYNNTYVNMRTFAQNGNSGKYNGGRETSGAINSTGGFDGNNVYYAPVYSPADIADVPLDTTPAFFQLRTKGLWTLVDGVPTLDTSYAAPSEPLASFAPLETSTALGDALLEPTAYDDFTGQERPLYPSRGAFEMSIL